MSRRDPERGRRVPHTTGQGADSGRKSTARPASVGRRRRRTAIVGLLGALVVAALITALIAHGGAGRTSPTAAGAPAAAPTTSRGATPSPSVPVPLPTPTPSGPTAHATELPPALPVVALSAAASEGNGVVASLPRIESIQGRASGPGNVAGPAVRVTVRITNGTHSVVSLDGVAVNMYYGADRVPASPLDDPSQLPFHGSLQPGRSADGVYVFSVPTDARGSVTVEVGYQAGAPLLEFAGPVR